ncbi:MAG: 30S ribosomal protein S5 [Chloroflexi bacterium]|nr:30S ribosomal protein S5 [Chloroflexota bacterium]
MPRTEINRDNLEERVVDIRRVTKVVKGGRHFTFSVVAVVGDRQGHVGAGIGKAGEVADAIRKAVEDAKKHIVTVQLAEHTIPHETSARFCASSVLLRPASPGTGVIAGAAVRAVVEVAGVRDVLSKTIGSSSKVNTVAATIEALQTLQTPQQVAARRGIPVERLLRKAAVS